MRALLVLCLGLAACNNANASINRAYSSAPEISVSFIEQNLAAPSTLLMPLGDTQGEEIISELVVSSATHSMDNLWWFGSSPGNFEQENNDFAKFATRVVPMALSSAKVKNAGNFELNSSANSTPEVLMVDVSQAGANFRRNNSIDISVVQPGTLLLLGLGLLVLPSLRKYSNLPLTLLETLKIWWISSRRHRQRRQICGTSRLN